MTEDPRSLFAPRPRGDSISSDDPPQAGPARRWLRPGTDNPTGWRLAGMWALGSTVVAATGLVIAAALGTGPPGLVDTVERMVVLPIGGARGAPDPAPPAAPVPAGAESTDHTGALLPGRLPSDQPVGGPVDPGYPLAPGVPLPPAPVPGAPGQLPPGPGTSLPIPAEPAPPGVPSQPTATAEPTVPPAEPTTPAETTEPPEQTEPDPTTEPPAEPTTEPPADEDAPEDDPPLPDPGGGAEEPPGAPTTP